MSKLKMVSLVASVLITTGVVMSLASSARQVHAAPPTFIDGIPVTYLPAVTVHATTLNTAARAAAPRARSVAMADAAYPLATQIASPHLAMPYYSFGSGVGGTRKD